MKKTVTNLAKALCVVIIASTPFVSKAQLKVSGILFGDYAFKTKTDSLIGKRKNTSEYNGLPLDYSGFNMRRAYVNFLYDVNSKVQVEAVLAHESTTPTGALEILPDNNQSVFLKYANVRIKQVFTGTDLILGQQRTPTFATGSGSEPVWQYRPIERTITDLRRTASSTDFGVGLEGKYMDGAFGYNVLYGNNLGAKVDETLPTSTANAPRIYGDVYYKFFDKHLEVQLYGDYSCYNFNWDSSKTKFQNSSTTLKLFIAYMIPRFTIGVEAYQQTVTNAANDFSSKSYVINGPWGVGATTARLSDLRNVTPQGLSVFAHAIIIADGDTGKVSSRVGNMQDGQKGGILSVFARYDYWNPDANMTNDLAVNKTNKSKLQSNESFITAGLDWQAWKNVHILPNVWYNGFMQKNNKTESGFSSKDDSEMVLRLTLWYQF